MWVAWRGRARVICPALATDSSATALPRSFARVLFGVVVSAAAMFGGTRATFAQAPPPALRAQLYSPYEEETIARTLRSLHETREADPDGKLVERVDVVPLDVIEPRDPAPQWLNVLHATTRKDLIRRELLLREGEPFLQTLVDETLRNLRRLPELSLVIVVATKGSSDDRVGVVIITKDVWSLRASWNVVETPGGIQQLLIAPTETNLLGTHQAVIGTFVLEPSATTFGLGYTIPRIDGSRIAVVTNANVMVNRQSGSPEGSYGSVIAGQPLISGLSEWAWDATVAWEDVVLRRYIDAQLAVFDDSATHGTLPFEYRQREYTALYEVTRSFGWENKHDVTLAAGVDRTVYMFSFPGVDPRTIADFQAQFVPVADTRVGPSIQYHAYTKRYVRVIDFETLALQEDFRLGHDIVLAVAPSFRALGSSRDVLSLQAAAQYTFALRDGLLRLAISSVTEPDLGRPDAQIMDASVTPAAHMATPSILKLGRIVVDGTLTYRWRNYLNAITYLGGESRLRGYPTNYFAGKDWFAYNVEFRTRPVEILTCELGGVAFYDIGDAFNGFSNLEPFQSVGFGFRALFPQLDRLVFRGDIGFPLKRQDPATGETFAPYGFLVSFAQAFDVPTVSPAPVLPTGQ
jgi:hypothetical protein